MKSVMIIGLVWFACIHLHAQPISPVKVDTTLISTSFFHVGKITEAFSWKQKKTTFYFFYSEMLQQSFPDKKDNLAPYNIYDDPHHGPVDTIYEPTVSDAMDKVVNFYLYKSDGNSSHLIFVRTDTLSDYAYRPIPIFEFIDSSLKVTDLNKNKIPEIWFIYRSHGHKEFPGYPLPKGWKQWRNTLVHIEDTTHFSFTILSKIYINNQDKDTLNKKLISAPYYFQQYDIDNYFSTIYTDNMLWYTLPLTYNTSLTDDAIKFANKLLFKLANKHE